MLKEFWGFAGPNAYNVSRGVGQKSRLSNERSTQSAKIGTTPRFGVRESSARQQVLPGPGQYGNPNVLAMSHHSNLPRVGFPKANRDANKKVPILEGCLIHLERCNACQPASNE